MIIVKICQSILLSFLVTTVVFGFKNKGTDMSLIKKEALDQALSLAIDMYEKEGNVIVKMDIPGIDPNDIQVEIEDGQLHVFGERKAQEEVSEENYYYKETGYGRFDRLVSLPKNIDAAGMVYEIRDGILKIIIPQTHH